MSKTSEYYADCAERGVFPLLDIDLLLARPDGVKLRQFTTRDYRGHSWVVTGIGTADAISWWNSGQGREVLDSAGLPEWLEDFAGCERCNDCGCVGQPHYFIDTGAETLCVECA